MARVLMIDDEEQVRQLVRRALEKEGHEVFEAGDGKTALKLLAEKSYQDLLISGTFELEPLTSPAQYKQYVEAELTRWRPIVTAMGIKID